MGSILVMTTQYSINANLCTQSLFFPAIPQQIHNLNIYFLTLKVGYILEIIATLVEKSNTIKIGLYSSVTVFVIPIVI